MSTPEIDVAQPHACPVPEKRPHRNQIGQGALWACICGKVFVRRYEWNYAGDWYEWRETTLRTSEGSA